MDAGTRVGPYVVDALIGQGGMGAVYRAHDTRLRRDVALKVLLPSVAADVDRLARFEREAQLLASLNHPQIAAIHGIEDSSGAPALVMELVDGPTLAQRLAAGPIPLDEAILIARQIAEALEAAHEAGIVHRDLKPANVKVRADGAVKVLDFGLAKAWEADADAVAPMNSPTITSPALTRAGTILGTAAYMSPEQAKGKPIDKRADIWAFGCVLYEMLAGRRAFAGEGVAEVLTAVLRDTPDWSALPASTPATVRRLVVRCLERDPKQRLRDVGDARLEIAAALHEPAEVARAPASRPPRWVVRTAWLATGAIVGAGAVAVSLRREMAPAKVARVALAIPSNLALRLDSGGADLGITNDGRRIVYPSRRTDSEGVRIAASQLLVRNTDAFDPVPLPQAGQDPQQPFVSPDGRWIGLATAVGERVERVLAKMPSDGGTLVPLTSLNGELRGASWTSDGHIVYATSHRPTGLLRISDAGGAPQTLTIPNQSHGESDHLWPAVLPDGGILFTIAREDGSFDVAVLPVGASTWNILVRGGSAARYLPSGHLVYASGAALYGVGFDARTLTVTSEPVMLVGDLLTKSSGAADYAVAADGTLAYVSGVLEQRIRRIVWLSRDGNVSALPLDAGPYASASLSPDGRRVAIVVEERTTSSLWVLDTTNGSFIRITPKAERVRSPLWSPDGHEIAFWSTSQKGIFTVAFDGSERSDRLAAAEAGSLYPSAWSPDGATLAFIQDVPALSLAGVSRKPPHERLVLATGAGAQVEASFSPNGRWLAHISFDGSVPEVVVGPVGEPGRSWPVAPSGRYPVWTPDGRAVLFADADAVNRVAIDPATGMPVGKPTRLLDVPAALRSNQPIQMTPDGRFLFLERPAGNQPPSEIRLVLHWTDDVRARMAGAANAR